MGAWVNVAMSETVFCYVMVAEVDAMYFWGTFLLALARVGHRNWYISKLPAVARGPWFFVLPNS